VWHIVDELPVTASGKPQKFKIVAALNKIRYGLSRSSCAQPHESGGN
jgi:hypothetical protein